MIYQQDFFSEIGVDKNIVAIDISREGDSFRANIDGGWWTATGKTKAQAVKKVVECYQSELLCQQ